MVLVQELDLVLAQVLVQVLEMVLEMVSEKELDSVLVPELAKELDSVLDSALDWVLPELGVPHSHPLLISPTAQLPFVACDEIHPNQFPTCDHKERRSIASRQSRHQRWSKSSTERVRCRPSSSCTTKTRPFPHQWR